MNTLINDGPLRDGVIDDRPIERAVIEPDVPAAPEQIPALEPVFVEMTPEVEAALESAGVEVVEVHPDASV